MRASRVRAPVGHLHAARGEKRHDERSDQPSGEPVGGLPHLFEIPEAGEEEASKGERDRDGKGRSQDEIQSDPGRPQTRHRRYDMREKKEKENARRGEGEKATRTEATRVGREGAFTFQEEDRRRGEEGATDRDHQRGEQLSGPDRSGRQGSRKVEAQALLGDVADEDRGSENQRKGHRDRGGHKEHGHGPRFTRVSPQDGNEKDSEREESHDEGSEKRSFRSAISRAATAKVPIMDAPLLREMLPPGRRGRSPRGRAPTPRRPRRLRARKSAQTARRRNSRPRLRCPSRAP